MKPGGGYYVDRDDGVVKPVDPSTVNDEVRNAMMRAYRDASEKALARAGTESACAELERKAGREGQARYYDACAQVAKDLAAVYVMLANQVAVAK